MFFQEVSYLLPLWGTFIRWAKSLFDWDLSLWDTYLYWINKRSSPLCAKYNEEEDLKHIISIMPSLLERKKRNTLYKHFETYFRYEALQSVIDFNDAKYGWGDSSNQTMGNFCRQENRVKLDIESYRSIKLSTRTSITFSASLLQGK